MKVMIVAVADFPNGFATAERIRLIARTLREAGNESQLALIHSGRQKAAATVGDAAVSGEHDGVRYRYMNGQAFRPEGFLNKIIDTLVGTLRTASFIHAQHRSGNLDAVVFYTPNFLKILPALLVAKLCRLACFFELCEVRTAAGNNAALSRARKLASIGDRLTEKLAPRIANGLIVISPRIRMFYADRMKPERIFYLPALADGNEFLQDDATGIEFLAGRKFILSSGSFGEKEGLSFVLEAFGRVAAVHSDFFLVFTGNPNSEQRARFTEIARRHHYEKRLIFTGYLSRSELIWCYRNAVALLACRTASEFAQFGFPTKLVEYMLSQRPILATAVGVIAETLHDGETAYLAEPENVDSIAAALKRLIENQSRAAEVAAHAHALAMKNFDYRCHVQSLSEFMRKNADV